MGGGPILPQAIQFLHRFRMFLCQIVQFRSVIGNVVQVPFPFISFHQFPIPRTNIFGPKVLVEQDCMTFPLFSLKNREQALSLERKDLITIIGLGISAPCHVYRSEEHTSELQSRENLVCRLLLEKKKMVSIKQKF